MIWLAIGVSAAAVAFGVYVWFRIKPWEGPILLGLVIFAVWALVVAGLGRPRPITHDFLAEREVEIIAYRIKNGEAIYLWVAGDEPMAYRLPWSLGTAQRLHKAAEQAENKGRALRGKRKRGGDHSDRWIFHPAPQKPLPPKEGS